MPFQKGRELVLQIGDGGAPEVFTTIGAARATEIEVVNEPVDATGTDAGGAVRLNALAGAQAVRVALDGLFRDSDAEALLRAAALGRAPKNYKILFPNGDIYAAAFVVREYTRAGTADGLEAFRVTLLRDGAGVFTGA
jgi:predicted secreted protein